MKVTLFRFIVICAIAVTLLSLTAFADDFIWAYGWRTTEAIVNNATGATPASLALGTCHNGAGACTFANADVTFTTSGVNFSATGANVATWVASNPFAINNLVNTIPSALMDATIWEFVGNISVTGTVGTPETFSVQHDDGALFIVNGQTVINAPGPTAPTLTTGSYTGGASGNAPFTLYYTECCGGPAVLNIGLLAPQNAPSVPEPSTLALLGSGFVGLAGVIRRRLHW